MYMYNIICTPVCTLYIVPEDQVEPLPNELCLPYELSEVEKPDEVVPQPEPELE